MTADSLEAAISKGQEIGKKVFGISVSVKIDSETNSTNPSYYDFTSDTAVLFKKGIEYGNERGIDLHRLTTYSIAHEFGHAKEARSFERWRLFPWQFGWPRIPKIVVAGIVTNAEILQSYVGTLVIYLQDFGIDHQILSASGLNDPYAKMHVDTVKDSKTGSDPGILKLNVLFNLPHDIALAVHGELDKGGRERLKDLAVRVLGPESWDKASEIISQRKFGDSSGYLKLFQMYFSQFLDLQTTLFMTDSRDLGTLPSFWKRKKYRIMRIGISKASIKATQEWRARMAGTAQGTHRA